MFYKTMLDDVLLVWTGLKGSWAFYLNYPQMNEVRESDDVAKRHFFNHQFPLRPSKRYDKLLSLMHSLNVPECMKKDDVSR